MVSRARRARAVVLSRAPTSARIDGHRRHARLPKMARPIAQVERKKRDAENRVRECKIRRSERRNFGGCAHVGALCKWPATPADARPWQRGRGDAGVLSPLMELDGAVACTHAHVCIHASVCLSRALGRRRCRRGAFAKDIQMPRFLFTSTCPPRAATRRWTRKSSGFPSFTRTFPVGYCRLASIDARTTTTTLLPIVSCSASCAAHRVSAPVLRRFTHTPCSPP